jgi:hypothetical protein
MTKGLYFRDSHHFKAFKMFWSSSRRRFHAYDAHKKRRWSILLKKLQSNQNRIALYISGITLEGNLPPLSAVISLINCYKSFHLVQKTPVDVHANCHRIAC